MSYQNGTVEVEKCHPSPLNPREKATPIDIDTIKESGIVERITVRPHPTIPDEWEIITGERRWLGAKEAGLDDIPAKIEDLTDIEVKVRQLLENLQREELNDIEQGHAFRQLHKEDPFWSIREIARRIGKTESYVRRRISLVTKLAPEIQLQVEKSAPNGRIEDKAYSIGISKAEALATIPQEEQLELAKTIAQRGMYIDELQQTIRKGKEIEKIISEIERPELREELGEKYLPVKYNGATKPSEILLDIKRAKGLPVDTPEQEWKWMAIPLKRIYNMFPRNSFVREWKVGDRQYGTVVMWLDLGDKVPELEREDHPVDEFSSFVEADRYAAEHGGYCSGLITIINRKFWCVFVEKKTEEEVVTDE